jgi:hypothetical protein
MLTVADIHSTCVIWCYIARGVAIVLDAQYLQKHIDASAGHYLNVAPKHVASLTSNFVRVNGFYMRFINVILTHISYDFRRKYSFPTISSGLKFKSNAIEIA